MYIFPCSFSSCVFSAYPNVVGSMVGLADVDPADLLQHQFDIVERVSTEDDPRALTTARQRLALLLAIHQVRCDACYVVV